MWLWVLMFLVLILTFNLLWAMEDEIQYYPLASHLFDRDSSESMTSLSDSETDSLSTVFSFDGRVVSDRDLGLIMLDIHDIIRLANFDAIVDMFGCDEVTSATSLDWSGDESDDDSESVGDITENLETPIGAMPSQDSEAVQEDVQSHVEGDDYFVITIERDFSKIEKS